MHDIPLDVNTQATVITYTYIIARSQFCPAKLAAEVKRLSPIRQIVGAIVRGPMKRRSNPTIPVKPITIYIKETKVFRTYAVH